MSARVYVRKFDWDEARRLRAEGKTLAAIAASLGVSDAAVHRVVTPGQLEREAAYLKEYKLRGRCDDCGGPMNQVSRINGSRRCLRCAAIARATTARDHELECATCHKWKPDESFPRNRTEKHARRGRHTQCRTCQTVARREHRRRNREATNAYQREYKRRRRASLPPTTGDT